MLICPGCKNKYKKSLIRPRVYCECGEKLEDVFTVDDAKVHILSTPYGNPENWAKSTLPENHDSADLVLIHSFKKKPPNNYPRERIWLHDALDDRGILYKVDVVGEYPYKNKGAGVRRGRKFKEKQNIYVTKEDESRVLKIIKKYNNPKNVVLDKDFEEEALDFFDSDRRPQVACPVCGKECDSDNSRCPSCKAAMY